MRILLYRGLLAVALTFAIGCAARRPPVTVWRLKRCARNGASWVCECSHTHVVLEATPSGKTSGRQVRICD